MTPPHKVCGCCGRAVAPGTHGLLGAYGRRRLRGKSDRPRQDEVDWRALRTDLLLVAFGAWMLFLFLLAMAARIQ